MAQPEEIKSNQPLYRFVKRWQRLLLMRQAILALIPALLIFFILSIWLSTGMAVLLSLLLWGAVLTGQCWKNSYKQITRLKAAAWLDRQHPALQHSTELLLAPQHSLSLPARLQQARIHGELAPVLANEKPPVSLQLPLLLLIAMAILGVLMQRFLPATTGLSDETSLAATIVVSDSVRAQAARVQAALPEVLEARIRLAPPAYTGQAASFHPLSNVKVPAASILTWQLRFSDGVQEAYLTDQNNQMYPFRQTDKGAWITQLKAEASLFYRIGYSTATDTVYSEFLQLTVVPDEPPQLRIVKPEQYLLQQQGNAFQVQLEAADEYGLEDLYLSLTISRGSGEQVSFREEKLWIEGVKGKREVKQAVQLNPRKLGMQPGDELYYRLEAFDNKPPRGQHSRSNTWFYQWQDTAAATSMLSTGLAMDLEPEYFRSQRQIILDTEKLIQTQKSTPVETWEKANQNLAVDQKLLRLRYGKFLGEEFESTAGGILAEEDEQSGHDEENHAHEEGEHTEEEHAEDESEYNNDRHQHDQPGHEEPLGAAPAAGLLEMFGHAHDTEEGATFYEESIKVKLKAALAEMWEAEKYLRLSQPKQALPYEYRALRIIKEVQQASRVYVERVGLDLPKLIPQEHRLKGEQDKILPQSRLRDTEAPDTLQASRTLVSTLSYWEKGEALSEADKALVRQASKEVARLLVQGGPHMRFFYLLNSLNTLLETAPPTQQEVLRVQTGLLQLLPRQQQPAAQPQWLSDPQKTFLQIQKSAARD